MIEILFILPIVLGLIVFISRNRIVNAFSSLLYSCVYICIAFALYFKHESFTPYFAVDSLNIIFLIVLGVLFFGVSIYNMDFLFSKEEVKRRTFFTVNILMFIGAMTGVILSTHLALLWVFIEATTLTSAYLIYYSKTNSSLEATWKYLFICSIGISIAFIGIILLSTGVSVDSLFFADLYSNAGSINLLWLKLAYPFMLVGFGTKVGFAPMHAWLPDAHSEAPAPVSALLSGALLNAGLLAVMRVNKIMSLAGLERYTSALLLTVGFLSLFIAAIYIGNVKNYKRMLAYSSIENMGIISIGLGLGGVALFAALLHLISHSITKAAFFLTSGNIHHKFDTKESGMISGLIQSDKVTGWLWIFSFIAIAGLPPFPMFISEFLMIKAMFTSGQYGLAVCFFLLLTIIMAGMGSRVLKMSFGVPSNVSVHENGSFTTYLPQLLFFVLLLIMGIWLPEIINNMIQAGASVL